MTDYSDVARMYNESASNWDRDEPVYRSDREARPKLVELAANLHPKSILDLGCGEGYVTRMLARATKAEIATGIDISEELIKIARRKEREAPLGNTYHIANITDLSNYRGYDLITAAFSTHYLSLADHTQLFKQAAKIGKHMIIATMDPKSYWKTLKGKTTYKNDEGRTFKDALTGNGKKTRVWYVHRTRERMEKDFAPFKIQERILIPGREANFDFIVYQLLNPDRL